MTEIKPPVKKMIVGTIIILLILSSTGIAYVLFTSIPSNTQLDSNTQMDSGPAGYVIKDAIIDSNFSARPDYIKNLNVNDPRFFSFATYGLKYNISSAYDSVEMVINRSADTVAAEINISKIVTLSGYFAWMQAIFEVSPGNQYCISIEPGNTATMVTYTTNISGVVETSYSDFFYDHFDDTQIVMHVENGMIEIGVNGIKDSYQTTPLFSFQPRLLSVNLGGGYRVPILASIQINHLQVGDHTPYHYRDNLHKTILPDGKDFSFVLHLHADRAYPEQFFLMTNLTEMYGIKGTYDAWGAGSPTQYGMDSPNYTAGLHELQDAGWDIGVHAGLPGSATRAQVTAAIAKIISEFGYPRTWSDHGYIEQDLIFNGTDPTQNYYTEDYIKQIGAAWWHDSSSSIDEYDLNRQGMDYIVPGHEDISSFRVSRGYGHDLYFTSGREQNISAYLRAWAYDRSVFVCHDYIAYYFYVTNDTGKYSVMPSHDGITNYDWSKLDPKRVFTNNEWQPLPRFIDFLNWTKGYNVWFTTVRDAYDRSCLVQKVIVEETDTEVRITNPTSQQIDGLTLYTKELPDYKLESAQTTYTAGKGAVDSWHFVFNLAPGEVLVLKKVALSAVQEDNSLVSEMLHSYLVAKVEDILV